MTTLLQRTILSVCLGIALTIVMSKAADAEVVPGCAVKTPLIGGFCDSFNTIPFRDDYCGVENLPSNSGCCCTPEAQLKINSSFGGETSSPNSKPILPSVFKIPELSVSIPGLDKFEAISCQPNQKCSIPWLAKYVAALQRYAIGIIGMLAVITLMIGGVIWLTAGGSPEKISEAKNWIVGSLSGLILTFGAYLLLYTINPDLTLLKSIDITYIEKRDLGELLIALKDGEPITQESAEMMKNFDNSGVISHTVGKSAETYKAQGCNKSMFDGGKAVEFFTTGYYKPPYEDSQKFFCDVGLQCSCPSGSTQIGPNKSLCKHKYKYCSPFPSGTPYCTNTASGIAPAVGHIAADGGCFQFGDKVCLGGKITLTVTDRGSAIKGRRFDIFTGTDRNAALGKTGIASVTLGACQ